MINGNYVLKGSSPILVKNVSYLPIKTLFENIGFTYQYHSEYKAAVLWYKKGNMKLAFTTGSKSVDVDSTLADGMSATVKISAAPIMQKGIMYVPLSVFPALLGANAKYDKYIHTVIFKVTDQQIKQKLFPKIGIPVDGETKKDEKTTDSTVKKRLTAKEIAKLMDRVGIVIAYDQEQQAIASGSGFIIAGGMFITNHHVVEGSSGIFVKIDGTVYDNHGWYWFDNPDVDLYGTYLSTEYDEKGMIQGDMPLKALAYSAELPEVGDKVYAIGSPLGLENTISEGIVSGIRKDNEMTLIQHTADTDHGSSGGVLLNEYGEVIGVTSAGFDGTNLDFAIPVSYVLKEIEKLKAK